MIFVIFSTYLLFRIAVCFDGKPLMLHQRIWEDNFISNNWIKRHKNAYISRNLQDEIKITDNRLHLTIFRLITVVELT